MRYFEMFRIGNFTGRELKKASEILKKVYPDGPKVKRMEVEKYSFNEIANHIHNSYQEISKSLYEKNT